MCSSDLPFIAGPHWTAYCEAYAIEEDDVVTFTYNEADHLFSLEVTAVGVDEESLLMYP